MMKFQRPTASRAATIIQERESAYINLEAVSALSKDDIGCIGNGKYGWTFSPSTHIARSYTAQDLRDIAAILEKRNGPTPVVTDY